MMDFDLDHRDARHDAAQVGKPRPHARPPRSHAEPQDRHRHPGRRPRPSSEFKGGKVEYRTDRYGNVHVSVGKASFDTEGLRANLATLLEEINRAKPASAKGRYIKKLTVSSTMGPSIKIDPNRLDEMVKA